MTCDKALSLQKIKAIKSTIVNEYAKCLALSNTLKMLINTRKKDVFVNFIHKKPNTMNPSESR